MKKVAALVRKLGVRYSCILAITKPGMVPAGLLAREVGINAIQLVSMHNETVIKSEMPVLDTSKRYLLIDDIYDTGDMCHKVAHALAGFNCNFCFRISRYKSHSKTAKVLDRDKWIVFPCE